MTKKLYPAMLTPLTEGGAAVDESVFGPMIDFLLAGGASGVFVCGTTGEGINLTFSERGVVLRAAKRALAGRGEVIVHCGAQTTRDTEALAADAAEGGAHGVAVIPPPYFMLQDDELTTHLVAAARASGGLPFYIYCFAARSGYPVPIDVVRRVREAAPNLAGLKVSEPRLEDLRAYQAVGLPVFVGNEPLIADACESGEIAGSVSALASVYPEAVRGLLDDPTPERAATVRSLRAAISHQQVPATAKALLARRGIPIHPATRPPIRPVTPEEATAAEHRAAEFLPTTV
jgi:dihydrodipicolinate synthase/N-acetylneuraminate lyase